jgi:hypothetical protein
MRIPTCDKVLILNSLHDFGWDNLVDRAWPVAVAPLCAAA